MQDVRIVARAKDKNHGGRLTLICAAFALGLGGIFFTWFVAHFGHQLTFSPRLVTNLAVSWEYCLLPADGSAACRWQQIAIPSDLPLAVKGRFNKWALYRVHFDTPEACGHQPCSLLFGEVGDAAAFFLSGALIGQRGAFPPAAAYEKHYPVLLDLPPRLLSAASHENELVLKIYSFKFQQTGPRRLPVGIVDSKDGRTFVRAKTYRAIFLPLSCALALVLLALLAAVFPLYGLKRTHMFAAFLTYCLSSAFFLVSFTEIPREYIPMGIAIPTHFLFAISPTGRCFGLSVPILNCAAVGAT